MTVSINGSARMRNLASLTAVALAIAGAAHAADAPQVFTLKGATLTEAHDVFRQGNLTETDFTIGKLTGHAVLDAKLGATYVAGPCRFVITPGEDKDGNDLGWIVTAHAVAGGPCPGVVNGQYKPK